MKIAEFSSASPAKTLSLSVLVLFFALLSLSACKKDADELLPSTETPIANTDAENLEILQYLAKAGFDEAKIEFRDGYVFDGDAGWERSELLKIVRSKPEVDPEDFATSGGGGVGDRQRGILDANLTQAVTATNVRNIRYFIRPSLESHCGVAWRQAFQLAAISWNAAEACRVTIMPTSTPSNANIIIGSDLDTGLPTAYRNLPSEHIALGTYPASGSTGRWISVNHQWTSWNSKLKTAMHEIGHCLGMRHTGSSEGQHIHGTPTTDASSIMNHGQNTSPAFTAGDLRAMRLYYPEALGVPVAFNVTRVGSSTARIYYQNPFPVTGPYYWVRYTRVIYAGGTPGGEVLSIITRYRLAHAQGDETYDWTGNSPGVTYHFSVLGLNFRRDVSSPGSAIIGVRF